MFADVYSATKEEWDGATAEERQVYVDYVIRVSTSDSLSAEKLKKALAVPLSSLTPPFVPPPETP